MSGFCGMYYKHQAGKHTAALIAAAAADHAFIQVITNNDSYYLRYPLPDCQYGDVIKIGDSIFSKQGVKIRIEQNGVVIRGKIKYSILTPIRYDIMGPFRYLPMQCRHTITSLHHELDGSLNICGEKIDFTGGAGYIEGDSGTSFPSNYVWVQCNDFPGKACITAAVANIPLAGFRFHGCICIVYIDGAEYRMATYLGVKIICCDENRIILQQGKLRLEIYIGARTGHKLIAPENGKMVREFREFITCDARFRFLKDGAVLFDRRSGNASFEFVL